MVREPIHSAPGGAKHRNRACARQSGFFDDGFVLKQDRYAIADRVNPMAVATHQSVFFRMFGQRELANRADQVVNPEVRHSAGIVAQNGKPCRPASPDRKAPLRAPFAHSSGSTRRTGRANGANA